MKWRIDYINCLKKYIALGWDGVYVYVGTHPRKNKLIYAILQGKENFSCFTEEDMGKPWIDSQANKFKTPKDS